MYVATSCGLPVKALRSCAAYATSCHIVLVVELPAVKGARGSNPSRGAACVYVVCWLNRNYDVALCLFILTVVSRASHCFCLNSGKFLTHSEFPQCPNFTCGVSGRTGEQPSSSLCVLHATCTYVCTYAFFLLKLPATTFTVTLCGSAVLTGLEPGTLLARRVCLLRGWHTAV